MCLGTYYLIVGVLRLPTLAARYGLISLFPLPYKHVWILSYTYRVLISPIDESSEQRNNKTKPKNIAIFHDVNNGYAAAKPFAAA